jgi:hypothetical protein
MWRWWSGRGGVTLEEEVPDRRRSAPAGGLEATAWLCERMTGKSLGNPAGPARGMLKSWEDGGG